jgi:hypothetical protein
MAHESVASDTKDCQSRDRPQGKHRQILQYRASLSVSCALRISSPLERRKSRIEKVLCVIDRNSEQRFLDLMINDPNGAR